MQRAVIAAPLAILLIASGCKAATPLPESAACDGIPQITMQGRVTDAANILSGTDEGRLSNLLAEYEQRTTHQMVIATTPSLHGARVGNFGTCLGNRWRVGSEDKDDGILILIAPNERQMRIATGLGMEKVLTDDKALGVVQQMMPYFKSLDYAAGLSHGIELIAAETGEVK